MGLATITLYKTLVMVILASIGIIVYKIGIVDAQINKKLSELVLSIFTPVLLFVSFQKEVSSELMRGLAISAGLSVGSFFIIWVICKLTTIKRDRDYAAVELIALMYSNCGFIGIPMAQGIFGSDGVLYMTAYVATANLLLWSHGVIVMSGKADLKSLKNVITSPTIISIILGLVFFLLQIQVPGIIKEPMDMIASMNTPMAMMVAGVCIAQADIGEAFRKLRLYWLSCVKLLVIPAVHIGIMMLLPIPVLCKTVIVLASACPAGVTGNLFALRYGKDAVYASEIFAMTTVLSAITVPLTMLFF